MNEEHYLPSRDSDVVFSIMMISYNHEHFIKKALDSILEQSFPYKKEIILGIDKCSDNTSEVCKAYQQEHPNEQIVLLNHEQNIGMYRNFCETLKRCNGKYIAILEGDDYWIDKQKLLKQFQYFENNTHCILSGSYTHIVDEQGQLTSKPLARELESSKKYYRNDLVLANRFPTLTVAFRRDRLNWEKLDALSESPHLDWPFYLTLSFSKHDFAFKFNECFGAYRQHSGGVYSLLNEKKKLANTARTVASLCKITQGEDEQWYLKALYNNLLKEDTDGQVANELFDRDSVVYQNRRIKASFLREVSASAWQYLVGGGRFLFTFKSKMELIRQTKYSKRNYLQLITRPFIVLGLVKMYFKR